MKRLITIALILIALVIQPTIPALAIALPDDTPSVVSFHAYRNLLETGDFLVIVYENTPYGATPNMTYDDAFVWKWLNVAGTTELAQATGYSYDSNGYGYNVISFYLDASSAPAWGAAYQFQLTGTPVAFPSGIPTYNFVIATSDYSSANSTAVHDELAADLIAIARMLDREWGLSSSESLVSASEIGTVLSLYGQSFFRGAIYGIQALAPSIFTLVVENVSTAYRTWTDNYTTALGNQLTGNYLGDSMDAGNELLDVNYNLIGLLLVIGMVIFLIIINWTLAGGMTWRALVDSSAILVIAGRISLMGLGEVALVVAICWLYASLKFWRLI